MRALNLKEIFADDPDVLAAIERKENTQIVKEIIRERQPGALAVLEALQPVFKGEKGDKGDPGHSPDPEEVAMLVIDSIPVPRDGRDGVDGRPGKDGKNGKDGVNGIDGAAAVLNEAQVIEALVEYIKEKKPIDISHIRNASSFMKDGIKYKIEELMHGGGGNSSGGTGGFTLTEETPVGTVDGSNNIFTVSNTPLYIVTDSNQRISGNGYTYAGGTITVDPLIPPVQWIRSYYNASSSSTAILTSETPIGAVNGSNVTFTVSNEPLYIVSDSNIRVSGQGYTYSGGTITMEATLAPVQFIISYYNQQ